MRRAQRQKTSDRQMDVGTDVCDVAGRYFDECSHIVLFELRRGVSARCPAAAGEDHLSEPEGVGAQVANCL